MFHQVRPSIKNQFVIMLVREKCGFLHFFLNLSLYLSGNSVVIYSLVKTFFGGTKED